MSDADRLRKLRSYAAIISGSQAVTDHDGHTTEDQELGTLVHPDGVRVVRVCLTCNGEILGTVHPWGYEPVTEDPDPEPMTFTEAMDTRCDDCEGKAAAHRLTPSGKFYCLQLRNAAQWERKHLSPYRVPVSRLWKSESLNRISEIAEVIGAGLGQFITEPMEVAA